MKPSAAIRSFLAITGSSLLAISYTHGQTILADSYITTLDVSTPTTLLPSGAFASFMVGLLTGSSDLTIAGGYTQTTGVNGTVSFTNNGASNTFNGNIIVDSGTLRVAGSPFLTSGGGFTTPSMTASDTITINRAGILTIDDNIAGGYTANRFGSDPVNLAGGTINLNGFNSVTSSVQTLGALTASSGSSTISINRNGNGSPTLTFGSLAISKGSVVSLNGINLGTGTSDARITFTSAPTLTNGIIIGAKIWVPGTAGVGEFATYGLNGVTTFTAYDVVSNDINTGTSSTTNFQMTTATAPAVLTADRAVNSLNYRANGGTWSLGGFKLTLTSGMVLRNGTNAAITINNGTLTAGNGTDDIDLHILTAQQNLVIDAVIVDNSASAVSLVKSHGNQLTVSGTTNSTYTGGTYVVDGTLATGNVASRTYLGTGKVTVDGASLLTLGAIGATSFSGSLADPDFTVTNGGKIQISNNNHGSVEFYNIGANSIIAGDSASGTGLASLNRGTNITLAPGAIIGHAGRGSAMNLAIHTIQNLGTAADLFYGLNATQNNSLGQITIGTGTAFRGISTDRGDRPWEQGAINIASGTTSVDFQGHAGLPNAVQLNLGNGTANATGPVIASAVTGPVDINAIGRLQLNDDLAEYGNTGASQNIRFVAKAGSLLTVTTATGMGSGASGIASALIKNGGTLAIGNTAALNGAVTVEAGGQFNVNQVGGLTGGGVLTFNEGSIILISGNATAFSGSQVSSATINPGTLVRAATGSFGAAGTTLDSILGSGTNSVSYITQGNDPVDSSTPGTALYTLNKSGGGSGGVLTNDQVANRTIAVRTNGNITLGANGGVLAATTNSSLTISDNIIGAGSLTIGTTAIIDGMPKLGTVVLNSANDYSGGTTINAGTLQLNNTTALGPTSAPLTVNAGTTLLMNNQSPTVGNLTGTGGVINSGNSGGRTLTIGQGNFGGGNFQGIYTLGTGGAASLTKVGTGTITLSGPNTYNGTTSINAGTLLINGDQSAAAGNVTVAADATLGGRGTLGGNTTVANNGKLQFNLSTAAGSHNGMEIATGKVLTFSSASTLTITSSGGASPGLYTLVSGGNNIVGLVPATVVLPSGWTADPPVIVGNELKINLTFTGGGNTPPTITDIANLSIPSGTNTGLLNFTVGDAETAVGSLSVSGTSNNLTLVPNANILFGGSGASRNVTVTPVSGQSGSATITVTVTDGGLLTAQDTFTLTVTDNYLSWATLNGVTGGTNGDHDNDGVKNLVEYALIGGGERGVLSGNTITYTKRGVPYGSDLTYIIETSETLVGAWTDVVTHGPGLLVTNPTISYTFTPGTPVKKFARLEVLSAP